jgi:hypothetical protein
MAQLTLRRQIPGLVSVPYSIFCGHEGSAGQDASLGHGTGGNQATLILQVAAPDLEQAFQDLLGLYTVDAIDPLTAPPWRVARTVPARHPIYDWLRCSRITGCKGVKLTGKDTVTGPSPQPTFNHYLVSCLFTQPHYSIYSDSDLDTKFPPVTASDGKHYRQEWRRWCVWGGVPSVEAMTREAGSMVWVETGAGGPTIGSAFNSPWPRFLQKQDIVCRWCNVPAFDGLLSSATATIERPINLENALYTVNDAPFRGYPAGTLLFRGYNTAWNEAPYPSGATIGGRGPTNYPSLTMDVELAFTFFDPPNGSTTRGHNLAPFAPATGGNGKWYEVVEATGSQGLFALSPFEKLFSLPG